MQLRTSALSTPPPAKKRPAFAQFLWDRGVSLRAAAGALDRSHEYVRRICLPFGDPQRTIPDEAALERIAVYTGGEITEKDFAEPASTEAAS